jgi:hypothetical protein
VSDRAEITQWAEDLGLVPDATAGTGETDVFTLGDKRTRYEIETRSASRLQARHRRRIGASELQGDWGVPPELQAGGPPVAPETVLTKTARLVALPFALVRATVATDGDGADLELSAPLFTEGLTKQAFALTMSGLINAVESFDQTRAARSEQVAAMLQERARAQQRLDEYTRTWTPDRLDAAVAARQPTSP